MCVSHVNLFSPDEIIFEAKELEGKETFPPSTQWQMGAIEIQNNTFNILSCHEESH